jgi:tripeptidyl-peptidase-1
MLLGESDAVELVQMVKFGVLHKQRSRVSKISQVSEVKNKRLLDHIPDICPGPILVTNGCLRQLYKTEGYEVQVPDRNMIATTGYLDEAANLEDAQLFLKTQRSDQVGQSFDVILVNGGSNPQELNQEQIDKELGVEVRSQAFQIEDNSSVLVEYPSIFAV